MLKYTIQILIVCQSRYPINLDPSLQSSILQLKVRPNLHPNISRTKHDRDKLICSAERGGKCGQGIKSLQIFIY